MDNEDRPSIESAKTVADHTKNEAKAKRRQLRAEQKRRRRNLKSKGPRTKNWAYDSLVEQDDFGLERRERMMPLDEGDRRRNLERAAFHSSQVSQGDNVVKASGVNGETGTITSVSTGLFSVTIGDSTVMCRPRGRLSARETGFTNVLAVGDNVIVSRDGQGSGVVEHVLPRVTMLSRPDVFHPHLRQAIVANAHQILIVSSWREPILWPELIDRYLIAAQRSCLEPIVCVNKSDLIEDESVFAETIMPYHSLGHRVVRTSAITGEGIDELRDVLRDRMTVLTGLSGTGKSSLISKVQPGLDIRTHAVGERSGEGRHTTTQVTALKLDLGGSVVDTPGIREFGLSGLRKHELGAHFPEMSSLVGRCRFKNCTHLTEPDCAVQTAAEDGSFPTSRYHSYALIHANLPI